MRAQEIKHGGQRAGIAESRPQAVGRQAGQRQQPLGARAVGKDPAKRAERQGLGLGGRCVIGGLGPVKNCQLL